MRFSLLFFAFVFLIQVVSAQTLEKQFPKSFKVAISNPLDAVRENTVIVLSPEQLQQVKGFNSNAFVVLDGKNEIASQYNETDRSKGIVFVLSNLGAKESREIVIRFHPSATIKREYKKLTQAELSYKTGGEWKNREYLGGTFKNTSYLRVPKEHKDHSWFIRYEGPGWESDKVGYRFYLDQRNATDLFGKKVSDPVLQLAGQDGFDSYHNMQPWGMDVMKVGKSLGVGSIGALLNGAAVRVEKTDSVTCAITENGVVYSSILTQYFGWQVGNTQSNVQSRISIHAGTRLTREHLTFAGSPDSICTGIGKDKAAVVFKSKGDAEHWGYIATYGKQSLNNDDLGLVVFFDPSQFTGFTEDEYSHIVSLKPAGVVVEYYFEGAWSGEPGGINSETQFRTYTNKVSADLANPVQLKIVAH